MQESSSSASSRPTSVPTSASSSLSPTPDSSWDDALARLESGSGLLARQIQAFIEASEEVDIDVETLQDLLETLAADRTRPHVENPVEDQEHDVLPEMPQESAIDISALYTEQLEDMNVKWSGQEIRQMMTALKERGMSFFLLEYVNRRQVPIPDLLQAFGINLVDLEFTFINPTSHSAWEQCPELRVKKPKTLLYFIRVAAWRELCIREKIAQYNTIDDAVRLIQKSQRILILTGAGISVSCGIPDFRSRDGLYATLANKPTFELDDPQQMFDIQYFKENPAVFYTFASQIYPSNFTPSPCHRFIKLIEDQGKLLRNYTQNIDTLETLAGVRNVLQCHGSFATASCVNCHRRVPGSEIEADVLRQKVPLCTACNPSPAELAAVAPEKSKGKRKKRKSKTQWDSDSEDEPDPPEYPSGIMKPDITFFGEKLTDDFDRSLEEDRDHVDLLLVIGTSLKVSPVSDILSHLPHSVPQILINKTPVKHINPDIVLLGDADAIVEYIARALSWDIPPPAPAVPSATTRLYPARNLKKRPSSDSDPCTREEPHRVGNSHIWLFSGAEGGKWLELRQKEYRTRSESAPDIDTTDILNGETEKTDGTKSVQRQVKRVKV